MFRHLRHQRSRIATRSPIHFRPALRLFAGVCLISATGAATAALDGVFTYQGQLKLNSTPAQGSYDLRFTLYDAETGGTAVGSPSPNYVDDKTVNEGLFTVGLDFGLSVFNGNERWLEVAVRDGSVPNGNRNPASYQTLNPRQKLTSTPYARFAAKVLWNTVSNLPPGFADNVDDLELPFSATVANGNPLISLINSNGGEAHADLSGAGFGASFSGENFAARGSNNSDGSYGYLGPVGIGVAGISPGWGGYFKTTGGSGLGLFAEALDTSGQTTAGYFQTVSTHGVAVKALNGNLAIATQGELASRFVPAVDIFDLPIETGVIGRGSVGVYGLGDSGQFVGVFGESDIAIGVLGETKSGAGIEGIARTTGIGIAGYAHQASGAGVHAEGSGISAAGQGTALRITRGAISVPGAGLNSLTPVFIHKAVAGNINGHTTAIDHPLTNNDPTAILFVTPNFAAGNVFSPHPVGVTYSSGKWLIFNEDIVAMPVNVAFNVLVIKTAGSALAGGENSIGLSCSE